MFLGLTPLWFCLHPHPKILVGDRGSALNETGMRPQSLHWFLKQTNHSLKSFHDLNNRGREVEVHGVGVHCEAFRFSLSFQFLSGINGILLFLSQLRQLSSPQGPMFSIVRIFSLTILFLGGNLVSTHGTKQYFPISLHF